jgi:hypothetical protein
MADGPYPREDAWRDLGLGHLLPMKLTGDQWPVQILGDDCFQTGPGGFFTPKTFQRVAADLEIGFDHAPDPTALARPDLIAGAEMTDGLGRTWIIPNANPQSPVCSIPREVTWTLDGAETRHAAKYGPLMDLCSETFAEVMAAEALDFAWTAERALQILQANYRIGRPELVAMEAAGHSFLTRDFSAQIVLWFIDFRLIEDMVKKNDHGDLTYSGRG